MATRQAPPTTDPLPAELLESDHAGRYPRRGLHGELVQRIGMQIGSGMLPPGAVIPIEKMSAQPVSRTVVREVTKVLATKGLVESRPKTGTRVRPQSDWNFLDPDVLAWRFGADPPQELFDQFTELRLILEPAAARLAAERATKADVEHLESAFARMAEGLDDRAVYLAADIDFHHTISACGRNELLTQVDRALQALFRLTFSYSIRVPDATRKTLGLHGKVVDAIRARDPERAESAMVTLITETARLIADRRK